MAVVVVVVVKGGLADLCDPPPLHAGRFYKHWRSHGSLPEARHRDGLPPPGATNHALMEESGFVCCHGNGKFAGGGIRVRGWWWGVGV